VADLVLSTETLPIFHGVAATRFRVPSFWAHSLQTPCFQTLEAEMERFGVTHTEVGGSGTGTTANASRRFCDDPHPAGG
jgi:hypothetical protein